MVKNLPASAGDVGSIPGLGRSPGEGNGNPLHYSCLENPHGQRSPAGYDLWGRKELDRTGYLRSSGRKGPSRPEQADGRPCRKLWGRWHCGGGVACPGTGGSVSDCPHHASRPQTAAQVLKHPDRRCQAELRGERPVRGLWERLPGDCCEHKGDPQEGQERGISQAVTSYIKNLCVPQL